MPRPITKRVSPRTGAVSWQVRARTGTDPDGKPRFITKTYKKRGEAKDYLAKVQRDRSEGKVIHESKLTLGQYLDRWIDTAVKQSARPQTAESYKTILDLYIREGLGGYRLDQLTPLAIQGHLQALSEKVSTRRVRAPKKAKGRDGEQQPAFITKEYRLSPRTIRYAHAILSAALKQAVRWRILAHNPAADVERVRQPRHEMQALGPDQAKKLLEALKDTKHETLFTVALYTGMRPGEYLGLKWQDINLKKGTITVQRTLVKSEDGFRFDEPKTERSRRTIPVPPNVVEMLRRYRAEQLERRLKLHGAWEQPDLVFTNEIGGYLERQNLLQRHLRPALKAAGLPQTFRLYDLRHSAATLLLVAGVHPKVVSERLGHASITMTLDTYSHVLPHMQKDASDKMEELLSRV
jgi:integrase